MNTTLEEVIAIKGKDMICRFFLHVPHVPQDVVY